MAAPSPELRRTVLAALGEEPATTSDLYDRIGYPALMRAGLIDYRAFRRALGTLAAEGVIHGEVVDEDEGIRWRARAGGAEPPHVG